MSKKTPSRLTPRYCQGCAVRDDHVDALKADQEDWRKGVGLIASMLQMDTLSCTDLAEGVLKLQAKLEQLQGVADQVQSKYRLLQDLGPDATSADGEWISAGWLEEVAEWADNPTNTEEE